MSIWQFQIIIKQQLMNPQTAKENLMLKEYIDALERENNSRNIEKDVLLRQIDYLNNEINRLRTQTLNTKVGASNEQQIKKILEEKIELQHKFSELLTNLSKVQTAKSQIQEQNRSLRSQMQNLNSRMKNLELTDRNNSSSSVEINKLREDNRQLKKRSESFHKKQQDMAKLALQNQNLQRRIKQAEERAQVQWRSKQNNIVQEKMRQANILRQKIRKQAEEQRLAQISSVKANYNSLLIAKDKSIRELQLKIDQSKRVSDQAIKNLNLEIKKLRSEKNDLEEQVRVLENERKLLDKRIIQLKNEVTSKSSLLIARQRDNSSLDMIQTLLNEKQQQLGRSAAVNEALQSNISFLEKKIESLEKEINRRQKSSTNEASLNRQLRESEQKYSRQIQYLRGELRQKQKQKQRKMPRQSMDNKLISKERQNAELREMINQLNQNNQYLVQKLKELEFSENQSYNTKSQIPREAPTELKQLVDQLRAQLKFVKSELQNINQNSTKDRIHTFNKEQSNFLNQGQLSRGEAEIVFDTLNQNPNTFSFSKRQLDEDQKVKYTKLKKQADRFRMISHQSPTSSSGQIMNRDKWQLLQRRISQLKKENAQLKNSLYS